MAGDWIKVQHVTPDKPEMVRLSMLLDIDQDAVVGKCLRLWIWADQQSVNGNALGVTEMFLDRFTHCVGFAKALREVGWLTEDGDQLTLPNFDRHNGETAKKRANTKKRVQAHRNGNARSVTEALPEKRREEKSITLSPHAKGFEDAWQRWRDYRESIDGRCNEIQLEQTLMELNRRGSDKAKRDIEFSILKNAKTIRDSDHDYEKQKTTSQSGQKRSRLTL